jgi:hypothetical protein
MDVIVARLAGRTARPDVLRATGQFAEATSGTRPRLAGTPPHI